MLNFRTLKKNFPSSVLKTGKELYDHGKVESTKILSLQQDSIRLECQVRGNFENSYLCEFEIDRTHSCIVDSNCDCPHSYDCCHLAAVMFSLESHLHELVVEYSRETDLTLDDDLDDEEKEELLETFKEAETIENKKRDKREQEELINEYIQCARALVTNPFFLSESSEEEEPAELALIIESIPTYTEIHTTENPPPVKIQLALRLPTRSKPVFVPVREFLTAIRDREPLRIGNKSHLFGLNSFKGENGEMLEMLLSMTYYPDYDAEDKAERIGLLELEDFGRLLHTLFEAEKKRLSGRRSVDCALPLIFVGNFEEPLLYSVPQARVQFELEYFMAPAPKILLNPSIIASGGEKLTLHECTLIPSSHPGIIHNNTYHAFGSEITHRHVKKLAEIGHIIIPEPLFGTFVENTFPEILRYARVSNLEILEKFATLPHVADLKGVCEIHFVEGELEATLWFDYGNIRVPAVSGKTTIEMLQAFQLPEGILARLLVEEQKITDGIFGDFTCDDRKGVFHLKSDKKIVEFMTEVVPRYQDRIEFICPKSLMESFVYDSTSFAIHLNESDHIHSFRLDFKVNGELNGVSLDLLWDCLAAKRSYIELETKRSNGRRRISHFHKILVIDLAKLGIIVQVLDEFGIQKLVDHQEERPLWMLVNMHPEMFEGIPIDFKMSPKLKKLQEQMIGKRSIPAGEVPERFQSVLRSYQTDGVSWLERLRTMHLNGILADDMGLGKSIQAITAITQSTQSSDHPLLHLIVCPTSLIYNWKEEFNKFNPDLVVRPVDGTPSQRKRLLQSLDGVNVVITSYSLIQKDIEIYQQLAFHYVILDEAQHIKNRSTRNAKSVKMIKAVHKLILTGTPIENSLEELWSLFDFLMPGLLSTYERFQDKYFRNSTAEEQATPQFGNLRRKIAPFILRRMKSEILSELPPVIENIYHCNLTETQSELYRTYANSAREELSKLVKKEGFERVQIHVLATLTRLKQICCHPAIFAKESADPGDSAKYDMLLELLDNLIDGGHRAVLFSQYTRLLKILSHDLEQRGISFSYLDGASKNRMEIVKGFNEDKSKSIFLVSLKAGGTGLNLVGADTVIHYDMWWNPAVENQATDRVHRIGQTSSVTSYKLVTLNTIEEKILELQNRKRGLVKKVIASDEEVISKLTWEEVLELLQI